jgi:Lrp/AsnC family transcriptional regulator, leucine-responsive regulatory protein
MKEFKLDSIDLLILDAVQNRGRIQRQELAKLTSLSLPAVSERLRRLEKENVIKEYAAVLDDKALGLHVIAFVIVNSLTSMAYKNLIQHVNERANILECHSITGVGSHILKIKVATTSHLEALLSEIQNWPGVNSTQTSIVLSTYKETSRIPIDNITNN